ncbi:MAG: 6-phosphofructokinase [Chloroflexota bacterium]|nr:6-phosphofructokinase [Chloroflexota bacterium]
MANGNRVGILAGGGPAPGINSVIGAATIRSVLSGAEVLGIQDGFEWLMQGDVGHVQPLTTTTVSRVHFRGGSIIGISRANPTGDPALLRRCLDALLRLGVSQLITIGGDDTAFAAMKLLEASAGRLRVVHVPKTIDNDLPLPPQVDTFGFQTARHVGVDIVKNLMTDAFASSHWYLVVVMGRKAGHLALGVGKAAGATVTLIPEEFPEGTPFSTVVDTLAGAIIKRFSEGRRDGVAVIAEGVVLRSRMDGPELATIERDDYGNIRLAEIDIGGMLKRGVAQRLETFGLRATIEASSIGYELRCADPIPYDMEYTRDLGYCAAKFLLEGGNAAMISLQAGRFRPLPFDQLLDPQTGRTRLRLVDLGSTRYAIARRYMIRLRRDDFSDPAQLAKLAATANLSPNDFRHQLEYLVETEPPPLVLGA